MKIKVMDAEISVQKVGNEDYISLTDMLKAKDGDFFITDWLRNRNTLEFIGIWEKVYSHKPPLRGVACFAPRRGRYCQRLNDAGFLFVQAIVD